MPSSNKVRKVTSENYPTDSGREGELIFRLVYQQAECKKPFSRLWLSSMEENAIREGFAHLKPSTEYDALYNAALCRERADWMVGINASRLFSCLYGQPLAVGRVMTPVLAMTVVREAAIAAFTPEKFYTVDLELTSGCTASSRRIPEKSVAENLLKACRKEMVATIQRITRKEKSENPPPLYDLTTLQRDANRLLGYSAQQTLDYVQSLYEKKLTTYPRTDSCYITDDDEEMLEKLTEELEGFLDIDLLEGKEQHCEFDGVETVLKADGRYCCVPVTHKVTLGEIVDLLQEFKAQPTTLMMPKMPDGSFAKKLYSLYLTYLPTDKFKYALKMNVDNRGSFTELVHTADCGQVSINISKPGITKGQHWHNSKWELFIVVAGHGLIQERNINTGETVEFEVSGDKIEAVHMIPGWTHNIINLSETENLVTVMTCNEIFNPKHPDTFFEPV